MVIAQQTIANTLLHYFFLKKVVFKQFFKQQKYCTIAIFFQMVCAIVFAIVLGFLGAFFSAFFLIQSFINFVFDKLKVILKFVSFSFITYDRYLLTLGVIFGQDSTVQHFYCYCNTFIWPITMLCSISNYFWAVWQILQK